MNQVDESPYKDKYVWTLEYLTIVVDRCVHVF